MQTVFKFIYWCYLRVFNGLCHSPAMSLIGVQPPRLLSGRTQWTCYLLLFCSYSEERTVSTANALGSRCYILFYMQPFSWSLFFNTNTHTHTQTCRLGSPTSEPNITVKCVFPLGYCLPIVHWLCVQGLFVSGWLGSAWLLWLNGSRGGRGTELSLFSSKGMLQSTLQYLSSTSKLDTRRPCLMTKLCKCFSLW